MFKALPLFYCGVWEIPKRDGDAEKPVWLEEVPEAGREPLLLNLRLCMRLEKAGLAMPDLGLPLDLLFLCSS